MVKKKQEQRCFEEIKDEYKVWKFIQPIEIGLALLGFVFPNLFVDASIKRRVCFVLAIIFIALLPLIWWFIKKVVKIIERGFAYPQLLHENARLKEENGLVRSNFESIKNERENLQLLIGQLINIIESSNLLEVLSAYSVDKEVFIILPILYKTILDKNTICALTDREDGYLLGYFANPIIKEDGIHLKSYDSVNPMLLGSLKSSSGGKLRPTTIAIIIPKENLL
jgi:hypothetical protein